MVSRSWPGALRLTTAPAAAAALILVVVTSAAFAAGGPVSSNTWAPGTVVDTGVGAIFTGTNFGNSGEKVVLTAGNSNASYFNAAEPTIGTVAGTGHNTLHFDAPKTNVSVTFNYLGTTANESLANISPAAASMTGAGVLTGGGTGVTPTTTDGTVVLKWPGPVQDINFDHVTPGGGASTVGAISYTSTSITLKKALSGNRFANTDQFTMEIHQGSAGGPLVTVPGAPTSTGTGSTVTAGTGTTGAASVGPGTTYYLTESAAGTTHPVQYRRTISCTDANGLQTGLPTNVDATNPVAITPVAGANITCTLTNKPLVPHLTLDKQVSGIDDNNSNGLNDPGDVIHYAFVVANDGDAVVSGISVTDPKLGAVSCPPGTLNPGASWTCSTTASHTVVPADITAGKFDNTATASGQDPSGMTVTSAPDSTSTPTPGATSIALDKRVVAVTDTNGNSRTDAGDSVTWAFDVTNTGSLTANTASITDARLTSAGIAVTCPGGSIAPGATVTCTAPAYAITQADVDAGPALTNTATAHVNDRVGNPFASAPDTTSTSLDRTSLLTLDKRVVAVTESNGNARTDSGDTITWAFDVTNSGSTTVHAVSIDDPFLTNAGIAVTCPAGSIAPRATVTCTAPAYPITQADVDAGADIVNTAAAHALNPAGNEVVSASDTTRTPITQDRSLSLDKKVVGVADTNNDSRTDADDRITWAFDITNTGGTTLHGPSIADTFLSNAGIVVTCPAGPIAPRATVHCTAPAYTITQAYIDNGGTTVDNTATASADDPGGNPVVSPPDSTSTAVDRASLVTLDKRIVDVVDNNHNASTDAGDDVVWEFEVTNTGTTTLTDPRINDTLLAGAGIQVDCAPGDLPPGTSVTCHPRTDYRITQDDIDNGGANLTNTATATADDPAGDPITSPADSTQTPLTRASLLTLDKRVVSVTDVDGSATTNAGDTITWAFDLQNTGTTTLTTPTVTDPFLTAAGIVVTCPTGPIPPGAPPVTCTAPAYKITQDDIDTGGPTITNTATAHANAPGGPVASPPDTTQTPVTQSSLLTLDKRVVSVTDADLSGSTNAGDTITWAFDLQNTGTTTLTTPTVTDPFLTAAGIVVTCPTGPIPPGAPPVTCTAPAYEITQDDIDNGGPTITNTATAHAEDPAHAAVSSAPDTTTTPITQVALVSLDKRVVEVVDTNHNARTDAGDTITWAFDVTNTGTETLASPGVTDDLAGVTVSCQPGSLAPGAHVTCTAPAYEITQDEVDNGPTLTNTATAHATDPGNVVVDSAPDSAATALDRATLVGLDKQVQEIDDVNGNGRTDARDTITWSFTVTNNGTTTLRDPNVDDPFLTAAGIDVSCATGSILPGRSVTCTAPAYTITQDDIDDGPAAITNTATATAENLSGDPATSPASSTQTPLGKAALLGLLKRVVQVDDVNRNGRTDALDKITWSFEVTNNGSTTLHDPIVTDDLLGPGSVDCQPGALAPQTSVTCTAPAYTITQDDIDHGGPAITNTATASAQTGAGAVVVSPESTTQTPVSQSSLVTVDKKVASVTDANHNARNDAGDKITWSFDVTNEGTTTLSDPVVDDPFLTAASIAVSCPTGPVAPGTTLTCTAPAYTITQDDIDHGGPAITNTATVAATDPGGSTISSAASTASTPLTQVSQLTLVKRVVGVTDTNHDGRTDAGDTITWAFNVTNEGTTTLSDPVVDDPFLTAADIAVTCPTGPVAPGTPPVTCTAPAYTITQDDIDHGGPAITNTATAGATDPAGAPVNSTADTTATPVLQASELTLEKRVSKVEDVNHNARTDAGDTITWSFTVTNSGTMTVVDPVVSDPMLAGLGIDVTCPTGQLKPGLSVTCTAPAYVVTQKDVDAGPGSITNVASASAKNLHGEVAVSPGSSTTTALTQVSTLSLEKRVTSVADANHTKVTDVGDTITWAFDVTNSGTTTLEDLAVSDPLLSAAGIAVTCPSTTLAPGAKVTCTAPAYSITAADAAKGAVNNTANARASNVATEAAVASTSDSTRTVVLGPDGLPDSGIPDSEVPDDLPGTGGPSRGLLGAAVALLGLGALLILGARRRS